MSLADEILADSPVGYWKFDETEGTTFADSSGSGYDLIALSGAGWGDPVPNAETTGFGPAARLDSNNPGGAGACTLNTTGTAFPYASVWTVEMLLKLTGDMAHCTVALTSTQESAATPLYVTQSAPVGSLYAAWINSPNYCAADTSSTLSEGYHHLFATWDGSNIEFYIDDPDTAVVTAPGVAANYPPEAASQIALNVVDDLEGAILASAYIQHLAIFDTVLSSTRRAVHMAGPPIDYHVLPNGISTATVTGSHSSSAQADGVASTFVNPSMHEHAHTVHRTVGGVVITLPTPAISNGAPTVPEFWARYDSAVTLLQGPKNIHAIKDPDPVWDPVTGSWPANPPPPVSQPWSARWVVTDLPDPHYFSNGYYWLGDPSSADGTASISGAARQWRPHASSHNAPTWRSRFPFKPSVVAVDHYLQGGGVVHHPRAVNFNSHFIEHMWAVFPANVKQPFTWVIAGMVASWPTANYTHTILDAGIDPGLRGIYLSANACNTPRRMNDGQPVRTLLAACPDHLISQAHPGGTVLRDRTPIRCTPALFVVCFNGAHSYLAQFRPGLKAKIQTGGLNSDYMRNVIIGRQSGYLDQRRASHILIFEMRLWTKALSKLELDYQYKQLSSTYQFDRYRN